MSRVVVNYVAAGYMDDAYTDATTWVKYSDYYTYDGYLADSYFSNPIIVENVIMPITEQDLSNPIITTIDQPTTITTTDISSSSVVNKITTLGTTTVDNISYTQVTPADEINVETLNRTAETLKASIIAALSSFSTSVNGILTGIETKSADQVVEINAKFTALSTAINTTVNELKTQLNTNQTTIVTDLTALKTSVDDAQSKIAFMAGMSAADLTDLTNQINLIKNTADNLIASDWDFIPALDAVIDRVNSRQAFVSKVVNVTAATGEFDFVLSEHGVSQVFTDSSEYNVMVHIAGATNKIAMTENITNTGFKVIVKSHGVHYTPQVVDCSTTPVPVTVVVSYKEPDISRTVKKVNADGQGTTNTTVGT